MNIITILQTIQPYLPILFFFVVALIPFAIWKGYYTYQRRQQAKRSIAHVRKIAGLGTKADDKILKSIKVKATRKPRRKFKWEEFKTSIDDTLKDIKKFNPFSVIRELQELRAECESIRTAARNDNWSLDNKIDYRIQRDKEPKKPELKDMPDRFVTRKQLSDKKMSLLIPGSPCSLFE